MVSLDSLIWGPSYYAPHPDGAGTVFSIGGRAILVVSGVELGTGVAIPSDGGVASFGRVTKKKTAEVIEFAIFSKMRELTEIITKAKTSEDNAFSLTIKLEKWRGKQLIAAKGTVLSRDRVFWYEPGAGLVGTTTSVDSAGAAEDRTFIALSEAGADYNLLASSPVSLGEIDTATLYFDGSSAVIEVRITDNITLYRKYDEAGYLDLPVQIERDKLDFRVSLTTTTSRAGFLVTLSPRTPAILPSGVFFAAPRGREYALTLISRYRPTIRFLDPPLGVTSVWPASGTARGVMPATEIVRIGDARFLGPFIVGEHVSPVHPLAVATVEVNDLSPVGVAGAGHASPWQPPITVTVTREELIVSGLSGTLARVTLHRYMGPERRLLLTTPVSAVSVYPSGHILVSYEADSLLSPAPGQP